MLLRLNPFACFTKEVDDVELLLDNTQGTRFSFEALLSFFILLVQQIATLHALNDLNSYFWIL